MKEFARNRTKVISSRVSKETANRLLALAQSRNVTIGTYLKVLIREYLSGRSGIKMP
jgi:predicted DNA-binding protein